MAQSRSQNQSGASFHCGYFGCSKTFTRRTGARRHETTVHGDKKYCCHEPDCNYRGGKRRNDFQKHMKDKHPGHDDHLFIPDNFSNAQESQSSVVNYCQSPEIKYASQASEVVTQMSPLPSIDSDPRFNSIDLHKRSLAPTIVPQPSAGISHFNGNTISSSTMSLRPLDLRTFQVVSPPRSEFESTPTTTTAIGSAWGQVHPSTMGDLGSILQDINGADVENEYEAYDGEYDLSRYEQQANSYFYKW
ncbi:hypothetical protein SBOR_6641 [Sclerotinia borealis F-4128]|uniref:C2H2-type domain-containing protein n=1 Tax=Sclerotinia borealis (strain F-4128) TaxID=1432307 RepID=W9CEK3_SCLBF|nr:hypothetical protein SBOR_6641 [Sclerotinia borealis F-4128]